jgi:hypothetical protein
VASRFESALMGKVGAGGLKKREGPFLAQLISRLQPKAGFSRLPPVRGADLDGKLRVDLTRSPSPRRTAGILRTPAIEMGDAKRLVSTTSRLLKNVFRGVKQPLRFLFVPVRIQNCSRV